MFCACAPRLEMCSVKELEVNTVSMSYNRHKSGEMHSSLDPFTFVLDRHGSMHPTVVSCRHSRGKYAVVDSETIRTSTKLSVSKCDTDLRKLMSTCT